MLNKALIKSFLTTFVIMGLCVDCEELSPATPKRPTRDTMAAGSIRNLKKIIVDFETDILSSISPITFSGTLYPWKIFSPAIAQAQHRSLGASIGNRRSANSNSLAEVLSSDLEKVHFYLYQDRRFPDNFTRIDLNQGPVPQNIYRIPQGSEMKILIHGFQSGPSLAFAKGAKNAYLQETPHTVIVVDWEVLSLPKSKLTLLFYPAVTANALKVGEKVAKLIEYLLETRVVLDLTQVHIIGHSLGAHAAGYAGDLVNTKYGRKIGRITALDAAFLAFIGPDAKQRLDKNDAKFVDAIHTSGIGVYDPIAHVDFYPNGGRNQVSCYIPELYEANQDNSFARTFEQFIQSCSHSRAYQYFIKSIRRDNFIWACKCANWKDFRTGCRESCTHRERFGEYVSPAARGKYFLEIEP